MIETNSYMQDRVVGALWKREMPTRSEYMGGIRHIISWASIGPSAALAHSGRDGFANRVSRFCENYGLSMQLADDMAEIDEDAASGYWSLPIIEAGSREIPEGMDRNHLIARTKAAAAERIAKAIDALPRGWVHTRAKAMLLREYVSGFEYG